MTKNLFKKYYPSCETVAIKGKWYEILCIEFLQHDISNHYLIKQRPCFSVLIKGSTVTSASIHPLLIILLIKIFHLLYNKSVLHVNKVYCPNISKQ